MRSKQEGSRPACVVLSLSCLLLLCFTADVGACSSREVTPGVWYSGKAPVGFTHFHVQVASNAVVRIELQNPSKDDDLDLYLRRDFCASKSDYEAIDKSEPLSLTQRNCGVGSFNTTYYIGVFNDNWFQSADYKLRATIQDCSSCVGISCPSGSICSSGQCRCTNIDQVFMGGKCVTIPVLLPGKVYKGKLSSKSYKHFHIYVPIGSYMVASVKNPSGDDDLDLYIRRNTLPDSHYDLEDKTNPLNLGLYQCGITSEMLTFVSIWNANYIMSADYEIQVTLVTNSSRCNAEKTMGTALLTSTLSSLCYFDTPTSYHLPGPNGCQHWVFKKIFTDPGSGSFKFTLHSDDILKQAIIAFEGSDTSNDYWADLQVWKTPCKMNGVECGEVHAGFFNGYKSLRTAVINELSKFDKDYQIIVTGHSLGGALAILCASDLATFQTSKGAWRPFILSSIGSPRVGNNDFVSFFKKYVASTHVISASSNSPVIASGPTVQESHRLVSIGRDGADWITEIPYESMGYFHTQHPILMPSVRHQEMSTRDLHGIDVYIRSAYELFPTKSSLNCMVKSSQCPVPTQPIYPAGEVNRNIYPSAVLFNVDILAGTVVDIVLLNPTKSKELNFAYAWDKCNDEKYAVIPPSSNLLEYEIRLNNCGGMSGSTRTAYLMTRSTKSAVIPVIIKAAMKRCDSCLSVKCPEHAFCRQGVCVCKAGYSTTAYHTCSANEKRFVDLLTTSRYNPLEAGPRNLVVEVPYYLEDKILVSWNDDTPPQLAETLVYILTVSEDDSPNKRIIVEKSVPSIARSFTMDVSALAMGISYRFTLRAVVRSDLPPSDTPVPVLPPSKMSSTLWQYRSRDITLTKPDDSSPAKDILAQFSTADGLLRVDWAMKNPLQQLHNDALVQMRLEPTALSEEKFPPVPQNLAKTGLIFSVRLGSTETFVLTEPATIRMITMERDQFNSTPSYYSVLALDRQRNFWIDASKTCAPQSQIMRLGEVTTCFMSTFIVVKELPRQQDATREVSNEELVTIILCSIGLVVALGMLSILLNRHYRTQKNKPDSANAAYSAQVDEPACGGITSTTVV